MISSASISEANPPATDCSKDINNLRGFFNPEKESPCWDSNPRCGGQARKRKSTMGRGLNRGVLSVEKRRVSIWVSGGMFYPADDFILCEKNASSRGQGTLG